MYELHVSELKYLLQKLSKLIRTEEICILTRNRKKIICNYKPVKSKTGKMSVSNSAIQLHIYRTELEIWVSGIQIAGKREQRFISTVVTNYFTHEPEANSWFFQMNFPE